MDPKKKKFNILKGKIANLSHTDFSSFFDTSLTLTSPKFPTKKTKIFIDFISYPNETMNMFVVTIRKKIENNIYLVSDASAMILMNVDNKILMVDERYVVYGKIVDKKIVCENIKRANFYDLCNELLE